MYLKFRLEYAFFIILAFLDKLKVWIIKPFYTYQYKKSTKREFFDMLGDNPDPSRWDLWVATTEQNEVFLERCSLVTILMGQISLYGDLLLAYNGFLETEFSAEECSLGIQQIKLDINNTIQQLEELNSAIPQGFAEWIDSSSKDKLTTRYKISMFIRKAEGYTLYMPFYR